MIYEITNCDQANAELMLKQMRDTANKSIFKLSIMTVVVKFPNDNK